MIDPKRTTSIILDFGGTLCCSRYFESLGREALGVIADLVFAETVVPAHGLNRLFDVVLNTADDGTLDKSVLCRKALAAFGPEYSFASSFLIEGGRESVQLFRALGGTAYQHKGDPAFEAWLEETGFVSGM